MSDKKQQKAEIKANRQAIAELQQKIEAERDLKTVGNSVVNLNDVPQYSHTFKSYKMLSGHFGKIYDLDWGGKDETTVLSAAQDGTLIVWNALTNNKLHMVNLKSAWVMSCAMSPNQTLVGCGGLDNQCNIYKIPETGIKESDDPADYELCEHTGYMSGMVFLDNNRIITSSGDSTCILWDIEKQSVTNVFSGHASDVMDVDLVPHHDGLFLSGSCDQTVKIWDHRVFKADVQTYSGHEQDINTVATSRQDGKFFASAGDDLKIILHDMRAYGPIQVYREPEQVTGVTSCAFSRNSRLLFTGYDNAKISAFDVLTGNPIKLNSRMSVRVSCLGVNDAGSALCTGDWNTNLRIWAGQPGT